MRLLKSQNITYSRHVILKESGESYQEQSLEPDLRQYWMPDEQCHVCYECGGRFTTFRRRHHCRICGHIFCSRCCNELLPGRIIGYAGFFMSTLNIYSTLIVLLYMAKELNIKDGDQKPNSHEFRLVSIVTLLSQHQQPSLRFYQKKNSVPPLAELRFA